MVFRRISLKSRTAEKVFSATTEQERGAALAWSKRGSFPFPTVDERQALKVIADAQFVVIDTPARPDSDDLKELAKGWV